MANEQRSPDLEGVVSKLFLMWSFDSMEGGAGDPELKNRSFIAQVLSSKMEAFDTGIVVPDHLGALIDLCTGSNPGLSQIILAEVISNCFIDSLPYIITPEDFVRTFTMRFPILSKYPDLLYEYEKKWDAQKVPEDEREKVGFHGSDNRVDRPEYWKAVVDKAMATKL